MLERVREWLSRGVEVRIVTARVARCGEANERGIFDTVEFAVKQEQLIKAWCIKYLGRSLEVTAQKDFQMMELWDDRVVRVETNTGRVARTGNG
jgi:hypothetical protein